MPNLHNKEVQYLVDCMLCDLLLLLCSLYSDVDICGTWLCSVVFSGLDAINLKKRMIDGNWNTVEPLYSRNRFKPTFCVPYSKGVFDIILVAVYCICWIGVIKYFFVYNWVYKKCLLYRVVDCLLFRGCIQVNGRTLNIYLGVGYIVGVHYILRGNVKWGSTIFS